MTTGRLDFRPTRHGFAFANRWPAGPALEWRAGYVRVGLGDVADGLCGGMCFAAADRYLHHRAPDAVTVPPARGSALFDEIVRRQVDSFALGLVPLRFWWAAIRLRAGRWSTRHQMRELRAIRRDLVSGRPSMLGLVRSDAASPFSLTLNHQVLAFGVSAGPEEVTLRIYDPNHPGDDDVTIHLRRRTGRSGSGPSLELLQSTGEPLLAVLRLPYRPSPAR